MNPMTFIGLLFDGAQVLFENSRIISVSSVNIVGTGVLVLWGISANRAGSEASTYWVALLSMGMCCFVMVSYAIVTISLIWHLALPILSNGLLILVLLALATRLLLAIKKKSSPVDSAAASSRWLLLR
jgi:hypothetical protein